jgi:uncharacterized protein
MIIDCHAHLLPARRMYKLLEWTLRFNAAHPVPLDVTVETLLEEYEREGVRTFWNFAHAIFPDETGPLNEWNRQLAASHPGHIVPFGTCHPLVADPLAVVDRCLGDLGFAGMKFHPFVQRFTPWEERLFRVYERIAARGGIVVFHTGFEQFYGGSLPIQGFEAIVRAFPDLVTVLAHANYPHVAEAFELVARYPNVYLDTVHVFARISATWDRRPQASAWAELRDGLKAFPDRVMFGTDHPSGTGTLAEMYGEFRTFGLEPELEERLLSGTALRLVAQARSRLARQYA